MCRVTCVICHMLRATTQLRATAEKQLKNIYNEEFKDIKNLISI